MERTMKALSPQSPLGSVLSAALVHGLLYGTVVIALSIGYIGKTEIPQGEVEIGYEVLNDVPTATPVVQKMVRAQAPEEQVAKETKVDNSPKELHDDSADSIRGTQAMAKPTTNVGSDSDGVAASTPFYKIKPKYPRAALASGTEGWIMLKIDVNEAGEVENVRVVDGDQKSLFQDEARRAVEKWKYRPFHDQNGKPIKKADHQVRVDFKLTDV